MAKRLDTYDLSGLEASATKEGLYNPYDRIGRLADPLWVADFAKKFSERAAGRFELILEPTPGLYHVHNLAHEITVLTGVDYETSGGQERTEGYLEGFLSSLAEGEELPPEAFSEPLTVAVVGLRHVQPKHSKSVQVVARVKNLPDKNKAYPNDYSLDHERAIIADSFNIERGTTFVELGWVDDPKLRFRKFLDRLAPSILPTMDLTHLGLVRQDRQ
ncbi:MAG TPA: hypothetical protein VLG37_04865 [Candidatus Saccharimonadales bacterium]|nr:hypothetical protein [Candidatus Saccharimonadales bacterium]